MWLRSPLLVLAAYIHGCSIEPICGRLARQIRRSGDCSLGERWHTTTQSPLVTSLQNMEPFTLSNTTYTSPMKSDLLYTVGAGKMKVTKPRWRRPLTSLWADFHIRRHLPNTENNIGDNFSFPPPTLYCIPFGKIKTDLAMSRHF